ncbi:AT-rich interactive domain-containing protein 5B-like [Thunnus albacares]|uniref:AT-rich interactive domain-containing protein 5B-like n=1 Tax=Thunnus albacares TaxID=8236 RepID=UPI001CF64458|nr:AT-rich interactive domain-containing protein 5B-like [Thunnus albacares]
MEPDSLAWVGSPCGLHGPYTFYKAFRFNLDGKRRLLSLGDFFLVRCQPGEPLCIAELQLLWEERTKLQLLSSSKLYFLPEDTPQGRSASHGEDEVIAVSEKVIVRLEDLVKWTVWDPHAWNRGMKVLPLKISTVNRDRSREDSSLRYQDSTLSCGLHFKDVLKEKAALGESLTQKQVLVLSYPRYCRYRSVVARLHKQPRSLLTNQVVLALGGIAVYSENMHILYCRDTFDHPTLLQNESVCDEFAPNLKGRPRKKKLPNPQCCGQGLEVNGRRQTPPFSKETERTGGGTNVKMTADKAGLSKPRGNSSSNSSSYVSDSSKITTLPLSEKRRGRGREVEYKAEEQAFLVSLYKYMKERKTPIERIPYLGFKQINLWTMYQAAQKLGGYEVITARRLWKSIYDELGGNPGSTSAATCTRRHYERLILPYEKFIKGEEEKPLLKAKARKKEAESSTESSNSMSAPTLKTKLTDEVKQLAQKLCPEEDDDLEAKDHDQSRPELMLKNPQLKIEPQICLTRLDPSQPSCSNRKRQSPTQNGRETQMIQQQEEEDEVLRKRRSSGCDLTYLATSPLTTPKVLNHAHSAVDLWQQEIVPLKDQCHPGKPRNLQSPTIPDPPNEQAELPRTEDTVLDFTAFLKSSGVNKMIISPVEKKKLLLQVNGTGLPNQDHLLSNFGQPPPLICSSLTNCILEEAAEQPVVVADSSVVVLSRPSVIQHAQSLKARVQKDRARKIRESTLPPLYSHDHLHYVPPSHSNPEEPQCPSTPLLTPKIPQSSQTPSGFPYDFYSSFSNLHCWYRKAETACKAVDAELVHDGSKEPQRQGATLSRDSNSAARFLQSAAPQDSKYPTSNDQENSSNPKMTISDDQPTDLSLPKASLKPLPQPYTSCPITCSTRHQECTPPFSVAQYSRACQVPPLTGLPPNIHSSRQDIAVKPYFRATEVAVNGTVCNGRVVKKKIEGDVGKRQRFETDLYNKMTEPTHASRIVSGSQSVAHNICVARPLNELGHSISKRRMQAVTLKDVSPSTPSRKIKTPEDSGDSFVKEGAEGAKGGGPASPSVLLNPTTPQIYPITLYPAGTLALCQVQDLCRGTLTRDYPHSSLSSLQYQSLDVLSPLVSPFDIHSLMIQRQLLAHSAASVTHIFQQPASSDSPQSVFSVSQPTAHRQPATVKLSSPKHEPVIIHRL